jgi:hypothetical protein
MIVKIIIKISSDPRPLDCLCDHKMPAHPNLGVGVRSGGSVPQSRTPRTDMRPFGMLCFLHPKFQDHENTKICSGNKD